jgi:hypothetical protein
MFRKKCKLEFYDFLFRSEFIFRTTQELEYLFYLSRKARNFFPQFSIRLYDKNSESQLEFHICIPHSSNQYTVFYIHCYE